MVDVMVPMDEKGRERLEVNGNVAKHVDLACFLPPWACLKTVNGQQCIKKPMKTPSEGSLIWF